MASRAYFWSTVSSSISSPRLFEAETPVGNVCIPHRSRHGNWAKYQRDTWPTQLGLWSLASVRRANLDESWSPAASRTNRTRDQPYQDADSHQREAGDEG